MFLEVNWSGAPQILGSVLGHLNVSSWMLKTNAPSQPLLSILPYIYFVKTNRNFNMVGRLYTLMFVDGKWWKLWEGAVLNISSYSYIVSSHILI